MCVCVGVGGCGGGVFLKNWEKGPDKYTKIFYLMTAF